MSLGPYSATSSLSRLAMAMQCTLVAGSKSPSASMSNASRKPVGCVVGVTM